MVERRGGDESAVRAAVALQGGKRCHLHRSLSNKGRKEQHSTKEVFMRRVDEAQQLLEATDSAACYKRRGGVWSKYC